MFRSMLLGAAALCLPTSSFAQDARQGSISVSQPWSRATAPRAPVGAGFLTIRNNGANADRLISATSPRAERVEIHTMTLDGGIMRMRPLANGIEVPGKGRTTLGPGGNHIMLIGLKSPLKEGERIAATLRFARAGTMKVQFVVRAAGASSAEHDHQGHRQ